LVKSNLVRIVELVDERDPAVAVALRMIEGTFERQDRQPIDQLRSMVAEKRLGLPASGDFHLMAAMDPAGAVLATATGVYLPGVNAGFVTYLAVREDQRRAGIGRRLRASLVERFRSDAQLSGCVDLAWVLGEVRLSSPWLKRLVRRRGAVPFDITYYHPGVEPPDRPLHALYRQPISDDRIEVPSALVRRLLYAVYSRGYRVRYPLLHRGFTAMLEELESRDVVGMHPKFAKLLEDESGDNPQGSSPPEH